MLVRTHNCGEIRNEHVGQTVTLNGWVNSYRDHGTGLIFVDLRDRYGLTQIVFDLEDGSSDLMGQGDKLRNEDCIAVVGKVRVRDGGPNPKLPTGQIEVVVESLEVLSKTATPPFLPDDKGNLPNEEIRLTHRYIDLRRPRMQSILATRHRVAKLTRDYFDEHGFLEIETPMLCRSTPEGARDFLVPSRLQPGEWYALPQSPQIFKQILMISGADRYLQICRCFRDEDPRADRQAEFTQIDLEMSFVDRATVLDVMEGFAKTVWKEVAGVELEDFVRITYADAMNRYGSDRPDLRYGLELVDISDIVAESDFKVFTSALAKPRGVVKAIRVSGGAAKLTRKITDGYSEWIKIFGAGGVPTTKVVTMPDGGLTFQGGIAKFVLPSERDAIMERLGLEDGDTVFFGADTYSVCTKALGELRQKVAKDLDMIPEGAWKFCWVIDFPMFEWDAASKRFYALHHPFTAPQESELAKFRSADINDIDLVESIVSDGYDMVCNGSEIGGGSIRIHRQDVQAKVFQLLGLSAEEAKQKFSFLLEALTYGPPPHGGIAFGLDRVVMHLAGTENIRDVIAFPKTQTGADLMAEAPNEVDDAQLKELHVASTWEEPAEAKG